MYQKVSSEEERLLVNGVNKITSSSTIFFSSSGSTILNAWKQNESSFFCHYLVQNKVSATLRIMGSDLEDLAECPVHGVEGVKVKLVGDVLNLHINISTHLFLNQFAQ